MVRLLINEKGAPNKMSEPFIIRKTPAIHFKIDVVLPTAIDDFDLESSLFMLSEQFERDINSFLGLCGDNDLPAGTFKLKGWIAQLQEYANGNKQVWPNDYSICHLIESLNAEDLDFQNQLEYMLTR
jgi:hypothetical protein